MDVLLKRHNNEIYSLQEELSQKNSTIKGFEAIIEIQKSDLKTIKETSEKNLTKIAEFKLLEANLNLEDNNQKKFIINLQKEIGKLDVKFEKKEEELDEYQTKLKVLSENLKENQKKLDESISLKKELQFIKLDQQRRNEGFIERERSSICKISDLESLLKGNKDNSTNEMQSQESYISSLQQNHQKIKEENWSLLKKVADFEHQLTLCKVQSDKTFISRKRGNSNEINIEEKSNEIHEEFIENPHKDLNNYSEIQRFSKDFPFITDSKETQTFFFEYIDSEAQTIEYKPLETLNLSTNIPLSLNRNSQIEEIFNKNKSLNSPINSNYQINDNLYTNPLNSLQKNNNLNNLLQNSMNTHYVYPTKITENLKIKKQNSKKNQVFISEEKKNLQIKNNPSLENSLEKNKNLKANTERLDEFTVKSTQNIKREHERHFSFNDKEGLMNFNQEKIEEIQEKNQVKFQGKLQEKLNEKQYFNDRKRSEEINEMNIEENGILSKNVFEMNIEEKEKKINQMFQRFKKKTENSASKFTKKIQKKLNNEDFDENKMNNFSDFREFFLKFVEIHKKCGKDCKHLKKFYERIGWNEDKNSMFRQEIKPIKTVFDSLPKIKLK